MLLVLDQFQHELTVAPGASFRNRVRVASDVATLSRRGGTIALLAGFTDMRTLLYRDFTSGAPGMWRHASLPDFNVSLYTLWEVPALRSVLALREFVRTRYPVWVLADRRHRRAAVLHRGHWSYCWNWSYCACCMDECGWVPRPTMAACTAWLPLCGNWSELSGLVNHVSLFWKTQLRVWPLPPL